VLDISLKEMSINRRSLTLASEEYVAAVERIQQEVGVTNVDDKQNKIGVPIADVLRAIRFLNMQRKEQDYPMDDNGQHGFQAMTPEGLILYPSTDQALPERRGKGGNERQL
jgi:hypothetical protein